MKSMKFASLILLCATSLLALVLPALGVVSFPEQFISTNVEHRKSLIGQSESPIEAPLTHLARHAEETIQGISDGIASARANGRADGGLTKAESNFAPVSNFDNAPLQNTNSMVPSQFASFGNNAPQQNLAPHSNQPLPPVLPPNQSQGVSSSQQIPPGQTVATTAAAVDGFGWEPDLKTRKVGTGIWLLLGPVWLLALLVWSISPSPGSRKTTASKKRS